VQPRRVQQLPLAVLRPDEGPRPARARRAHALGRLLVAVGHGRGVAAVGRRRRRRGQHGRRPAQVHGALRQPDLAVDLRVLADAVLQVGDVRLQPDPSASDARTVLGPLPRRALRSAIKRHEESNL